MSFWKWNSQLRRYTIIFMFILLSIFSSLHKLIMKLFIYVFNFHLLYSWNVFLKINSQLGSYTIIFIQHNTIFKKYFCFVQYFFYGCNEYLVYLLNIWLRLNTSAVFRCYWYLFVEFLKKEFSGFVFHLL